MKNIYLTILIILVSNSIYTQDFNFDINKSVGDKVFIYDDKNEKLGHISVRNNTINYYDINDELVKFETFSTTKDITIKNFMDLTKNGTVSIYVNRSKFGIRQWNNQSYSFDIFDNNDEKIGVYYEGDGNGIWKYKEEANFKNSENYSITFTDKTNTDSENQSSVTFNNFNKNNASNQNNNSVSNSTSSRQTTYSSYVPRKNKSSFIFPEIYGVLYLGTSIYGDNNESIPNNKFEIGYFDYSNNYFGFQFANQKSNLSYQSDYGDLNDQIWALSYGRGLFGGSTLYLKIDLGYHTYNYPTVESFGDFYDIGEGFYGNLGLRLIVFDFGGLNIIGEYNIDSKGLNSYGFGVGIQL